jgi:hypothetical protein
MMKSVAVKRGSSAWLDMGFTGFSGQEGLQVGATPLRQRNICRYLTQDSQR